MFGLIQKMDRYSNKLMSEREKIDFIQEIVDNGMVWDMHQKYVKEAKTLMGAGKVFDLDAPAIPDDVLDAAGSERPTSPFWRSICY
jgi:hypothetical protein|tara:strand:+ start:65 stop:322 length:258 start_codon:yes stop_codon:yes gene_type:complete